MGSRSHFKLGYMKLAECPSVILKAKVLKGDLLGLKAAGVEEVLILPCAFLGKLVG